MKLRRNMKFLYLLTLMIFISATSVKHKNKDLILWTKEYKLQWTDFQGKPKKGSRFAAATDGILRVDRKYSDKIIIINVNAFFVKKVSWKKKETNYADLLIHEQKHFDIVEIYARKLRKLLIKHDYSSVKLFKDVEKIIEKYKYDIKKELFAYHDKYDGETSHSKNKEVQEKWNKIIEDELQSLDEYNNVGILIPVHIDK